MARRVPSRGPKEWTPLDGRRILVGELGDVNPLEHGGTLIYKIMDPDGIYYEAVRIDPMINHNFQIRRWTIEEDVLADASWVDDYLKDLARAIGVTPGYVKRLSVHPDVRLRASLYEDIASYFGLDNLDAYPVFLTREEALERFPELK